MIQVADELPRLERLFYLWADWMSHGGTIARGFPKQSLGFIGSGKNSSDDFADSAESQTARIMDTIINDLPKEERAAINFRYLGSRYMYDSEGFNYSDTLDNAKIIVENQAEKKGIL